MKIETILTEKSWKGHRGLYKESFSDSPGSPRQREGKRRGNKAAASCQMEMGSSPGAGVPCSTVEGLNSKSHFCHLNRVGTEKKSRLNPE